MTDQIESRLKENLDRVLQEISDACTQVGRDPSSVTLVAASKGQPLEVLEAYVAIMNARGIKPILGENYAQELENKANALKQKFSPEQLEFHFIGRMQSNKAEIVAQHCTAIHSVCSVKSAKALVKERSKISLLSPLTALIQVNISSDPAKDGVSASELPMLWSELQQLPREQIRIRGLMTILDFELSKEQVRAQYRSLKHLTATLAASQPLELSMGMSADFDVAVEEGATLVRVGTSLFGKRQT